MNYFFIIGTWEDNQQLQAFESMLSNSALVATGYSFINPACSNFPLVHMSTKDAPSQN